MTLLFVDLLLALAGIACLMVGAVQIQRRRPGFLLWWGDAFLLAAIAAQLAHWTLLTIASATTGAALVGHWLHRYSPWGRS